MSDWSKISVVIPNYNNEKYLPECLDSVLAQNFPNLEVVVVDDASSDNSASILKAYQDKDHRLKVIHKNKNEGVVKARHSGIEVACGEYITTLDSDDIYLCNDKLSSEHSLIKQHEVDSDSPKITFSKIQLMRENGESIGVPNTRIDEGDIFGSMLGRSVMIPRDFLFKKSLYFEVGGFDTNIPLYEDWDLKLRLARKAEFFCTNQPGIGYRQHQGGLSKTHAGRHAFWLFYVYCKNISLKRLTESCLAFPPLAKLCARLLYKKLVNSMDLKK